MEIETRIHDVSATVSRILPASPIDADVSFGLIDGTNIILNKIKVVNDLLLNYFVHLVRKN